MIINVKSLKKLADKNGWKPRVLAEKLNVEYSYLTRVLRGERIGGAKVVGGLYGLCKRENLNVDDYIFLDIPLSTNKGKSKSA